MTDVQVFYRRYQMFYKLLAIVLLFVATACGNRRGAGSPQGQADTPEDSTCADTAIAVPGAIGETLTALPDSAMPSARVVRYTVERFDTVAPGELSGLDDLYASAPGAFTFRKGIRRDADFGGRIKGTPSDIVVDWSFKTAVDDRETKYGRWGGGTGWTGQPLYVEWPDSVWREFSARNLICRGASRREIIVGTLASTVCFIDFESGKASRPAVDVLNPVKGTVSLDPTLNGNLYVGLGIPAERPFGARVVDLYDAAVTYVHPDDPNALRRWDAYDSSPLRVGQFLFWPGENGTIYKFTIAPGRLRLHSALRYTVNGAAPGVENSMAVYLNYGYFGDNHGNLLCVNLETLKPIWRCFVGDDIDATPMVTVEGGTAYVYAACEVDRQVDGMASLVKVDALSGRELWRSQIAATRADVDGKHFDGGYYGSPLAGTADCAHMVFANCVLNQEDKQNGVFVAFDRETGHELYRTPLRRYAWSSPVGFVSDTGKMFVLTGDCAGNIYLIDGHSGEIIVRKAIGSNFESSPVVVGNSVVVGSRGDTIYRLSVV